MDDADRAQIDIERADRTLQTALRARRTTPQDRSAVLVDCCDCGEPIPPARLGAVPGAYRCIDCQADAERL